MRCRDWRQRAGKLLLEGPASLRRTRQHRATELESLPNTVNMFITSACFALLHSYFLQTRLEATNDPFLIPSKREPRTCFMSIWTIMWNLECVVEGSGDGDRKSSAGLLTGY